MSTTQIHRYLFKEVLAPTLLCMVIFIILMVLGRAYKLVDLIINKGVAMTDILTLLATLLPIFVSFSLPLAFLMGMMIGLGRLSADSECVALKAAGVGLAKMALPVFTLAVLFGVMTAATDLWVKPLGYRAFATKSFEIARQKATIGLQPRVFINDFNNLVLYANEVDARNNQLEGLFIVEKKPASTAWVFADRGRIFTDNESQTVTIRLQDGVIHRQQAGSDGSFQLIHFRNYDVQPEVTESTSAVQRSLKPKEMATGTLWGSPPGAPNSPVLQAEFHSRLIAPLAPLLFALFGLPFSMQSQRTGRSGGFVMGLLIFVVYYVITSAAFTLTRDAAIQPWLTYWLPHTMLAGTGAAFFYRAAQEQPSRMLGLLDQVMFTVQKRMRKHEDS